MGEKYQFFSVYTQEKFQMIEQNKYNVILSWICRIEEMNQVLVTLEDKIDGIQGN